MRKTSPDEEEADQRHQRQQGGTNGTEAHDSPKDNLGRPNRLGDNGVNRFVFNVFRKTERTDAKQKHGSEDCKRDQKNSPAKRFFGRQASDRHKPTK